MEPKSKLSSDTVDWCKEQGSKAETLDDVLAGPDTVVMEAIQAGIDRYNKGLHNIGRNHGMSVLTEFGFSARKRRNVSVS